MQLRMYNQNLNRIPKTYFGRRSQDVLREIKGKNIVIISSKILVEIEDIKKIVDLLSGNEVRLIISEHNNIEEINKISAEIKKTDKIISIGGGNILDFSKLICLKLDNPDLDLKSINQANAKRKTELIAIPSTPSTGSQVTPVAITHTENGEKVIIVNESLIPDLVILSPFLLKSISQEKMAEFICDIFAHTVEAHVSRLSNFFIRELAELNLNLLLSSWKKYKENPEDTDALEKIAMCGQIGGICQGNAFVGIMHSIAHQVEPIQKMEHSAILLEVILPVLQYYKEKTNQEIYSKFIDYFNELGLKGKHNIFEGADEEELSKKILNDPSIKTSPIIFDQAKVMELIKWIKMKK